MKNIVRAFVVVLALTGFAASAHTATAMQNNPQKIALVKTSDFPIPVCPPDDPTGCNNPLNFTSSK